MDSLDKTVLKHDMCIGCGACAYVKPEAYTMHETPLGFIKARGSGVTGSKAQEITPESVCPFSNESVNEDDLAHELFSDDQKHHTAVGKYLSCYVGRVNDASIYQKSSSGGIARWLLATLVKEGVVDAVATVFDQQPGTGDNSLFAYGISRDPEEILNASRSAYYPVELSKVLRQIKEKPGRYAITGVPCFIKAIRNLCRQDPVLNERVVLTIGIICGHLKSRFYAELLAWQVGIAPNDLGSMDFRHKIPGRNAREKGVYATSRTSGAIGGPEVVQKLFGTDYGQGFFKYKACDFCDDVFAETADISIGDAWLPEFLGRGTSLVIVRDPRLAKILELKSEEGAIWLESLSGDQAAQSQDAGLRHRRLGLSYRLFSESNVGNWVPRKRVDPDNLKSDKRYRRIIQLRSEIGAASGPAFLEAKIRSDLRHFVDAMSPFVGKYQAAYRPYWKGCLRIIVKYCGFSEARIASVSSFLRNCLRKKR